MKYLYPLRDLMDIGPKMSECISCNTLSDLLSLLGKTKVLFLDNEGLYTYSDFIGLFVKEGIKME